MKEKTKKFLSSMFAVGFLLLPAAGCAEDASAETYTIDFSAKTGTEVQFVKKIDAHCPVWPLNGNMNATLNSDALYTIGALKGMNAEYFRTDMFFGNYGLGASIGSDSGLTGLTDVEYSTVMQLEKHLSDAEIKPYLVLNGIPEYAQTGGYNRKPDYEKYAEVMGNMAAYLKAHGVKAAYETWNEPDLADWYDGVYDLMRTSATATSAIKRADENATVSALGLAFVKEFFSKSETADGVTMSNFERFLAESEKEMFPDAIAWHYYGSETGQVEGNFDEGADFTSYLSFMHGLINEYAGEYEELCTLEQHLTEYHPVSTMASVEDTTQLIGAMFASIEPLLKATDVSRAFWPMYISDSFGVIDKDTYRYNPSYSVLWCYGRLPVDRIAVPEAPENVGIYAAADNSRAGIVLFNGGQEEVRLRVSSENIPFASATTDVYEVSVEHINYNAGITAPYQLLHKTGEERDIAVTLKGNSAVYIEYNDESGASDLDRRPDAEFLKKEYYYDTRAYGMPYSDVHSESLTVFTSMADNATGKTAANLKLKAGNILNIGYESWGDFSAEGTLGVKVSFRRENGEYANSVFYALGDGEEFSLPFGTGRMAEEILSPGFERKGKISVRLTDKAPADWSGEIALTFLMKDAGRGATVKYMVG